MVNTLMSASEVRKLLVERAVLPDRIVPGDADEGISNSEVDVAPMLVVRCRDARDVESVVAVARQLDLSLAVRGGGYSPGGLGTIEGGIVVDVGDLHHIDVDVTGMRVRVGAGVLTGDLERALDAHGLGMTLPVPSRAGVVGAALSGGVGVLLRKLGYISDAIVGATVVTGSGESVTVDEADTTGLLWALKGGGGNFGVVTELVFRCIVQQRVTTAQLVFGQDRLRAALEFYRDWTPGLPDDVTAVAMFRSVPPFPGIAADLVGTPGLILTVIHADPDAAEPDLAGLSAAPDPIFSRTTTGSLLELREAMERGFPAARFGAIIRSGWSAELSDNDIIDLAALAGALPSPHSIVEVVRLGGAIATMTDPGCAPGRDAEFLLNAMALWVDEADAAGSRDWAVRGGTVIHSVADGSALIPGFISGDELDRADTTYDAQYARLRELKTTFDPRNLFTRNLNIQPLRSTR
ncbi:FAD-binding oxidoreductase [soil metagenome]